MARPARISRALSQNFLADRATADYVARLAVPHGRQVPLLLEVGAGKGALTARLAPAATNSTPTRSTPARPETPHPLHRQPQVRVIAGDFMDTRPPRTPFAVAGNVPFSRTADIVDWCLRAPALTDATLLTQLEYARKRTGDYGSWTLLTVRSWPRHDWRLVGRVDRRRFSPVPRVDAGIVRIEQRRTPLLEPAALHDWRRLVELGFSGVGGSLHASLRRAHPRRRVDAAFRAARLDPRVLVGEVSPDHWLRLHQELTS